MLKLLRIRHFALIDELELEFHHGFNVLTGETGAGKSIILDAIALILGARANPDLIRNGQDEAVVEALFDVGHHELILQKLKSFGLDLDRQDHELMIKRVIHRNGKNKIYLNQELFTLTHLAEVCGNLVELCSQHEHQSLSKPFYQLELLDRYGGLLENRRKVRELHAAMHSAEKEYGIFKDRVLNSAQAEDFLKFQILEIEEANLREGEDESLQEERKKWMHFSILVETLEFLLGSLQAEGNPNPVLTQVSKLIQRLEKNIHLEPSLSNPLEMLKKARIELDEAHLFLKSYLARLPSNAEELTDRIAQIDDRWSQLQNLKRKHGAPHIKDLINKQKLLIQELDLLENHQKTLLRLETKVQEFSNAFEEQALDLSLKRKNVAVVLSQSVEKELEELHLLDQRFKVEFSGLERSEWGPEGLDRIRFLFSANPGEPEKAIAKVASGGELSRLMLALRRTIADRGGIGVYLFDEIDAGIGGKTASVVGRKLKAVAQFNQVICITHLPQVAAYADVHFVVEKTVQGKRTATLVHALKNDARVAEIARMLGGLDLTEHSKAHAKDLLRQALQQP